MNSQRYITRTFAPIYEVIMVILSFAMSTSTFVILIWCLLLFQNFSVELQLENLSDLTHDFFKLEVDKSAGANYGTGIRVL